uniref:TFIIS N-terminal domain-containing protein n=1 Tax=Salix viminalis TaxID=40686 RepID=A0A6N2JZE4_SALVM
MEKKLRLMALTVDTLKATEIGKAVNVLRKHGSKQIRYLARTLIEDWKVLVDEWYSTANAIRGDEGTPDSVNPSVVDEEEGLPSPPLDEGAFFATQPTSMELSQFFDGMDDDGMGNSSRTVKVDREHQ